MEEDSDIIKDGKYVMIQRGDHQRVIHFNSQQTVGFGKGQAKQTIQLKNALNKKFYSAFRVLPFETDVKADKHAKPKGNKEFYLEELTEPVAKSFGLLLEIPASVSSGKDNRNIFDDKLKSSQKLAESDIANLRDQGLSSQAIVTSIISGSSSFASKTEFSQEKYLKKKEKVHGDVLLFLKIELSLIADYYFSKDPSKILGLRPDSLSQILSYANIHANGKYIVYENANSLLVAAILQRLGGLGLLLHCHMGSNPQRQTLSFMNFNETQLSPLRNLDVFYLIKGREITRSNDLNTNGKVESTSTTDVISMEEKSEEPPAKRVKSINDDDNDDDMEITSTDGVPEDENISKEISVVKSIKTLNRVENEKSLDLLTSDFDGLIICAKEHPLSILQRLIPYLSLSCPFIVYSIYPEPLIECYMWIKDNGLGINIQIMDNWLRNIQVDTDRTHPEINMSSSGGYIMYGIYVNDAY